MPNQLQTNTEHGFHPTVMRAGVSFTVVRIGDPIDDPVDQTKMLVYLQPMAFVRVTLLNPYNFRLPADEYLFELSIPDELFIHWRRKEPGNSKATEELDNTRLPESTAGARRNSRSR